MQEVLENNDLIHSEQKIVDCYQDSASNYDRDIALYNKFWQIFGFRYEHYRKKAIDALNLKEGQTVVDLGCGTGLNFPHLEKLLGKSGHIIGVDISNDMIAIADEKIKKNNWNNISLIKGDFAKYIPQDVDAIISTYSLGLSKSYDDVICHANCGLKNGGRLVILGFKDQNLSFKAKMFLPFWLSCIKDYSYRTFTSDSINPWDSVKRCFSKNQLHEFYGGLAYLSTGIKTN